MHDIVRDPVSYATLFKVTAEAKNWIYAGGFSQIFILCDSNTVNYCVPQILHELEISPETQILVIPAGESSKDITQMMRLWEELKDHGADRRSLILNIGGGVVTDLGGFLASTYMRGIPFMQVPTTLLAMVDAAIGGKNGIDYLGFKNLIGTITQPAAIFLQPSLLETLPQDELLSGFAEMLKHGIIADASHFDALSQLTEVTPKSIAPYISRSAEIKVNVVGQDPYETGIRKILNFGHTMGHALESCFLKENNPIPHGFAVAAGMIMETTLSLWQKTCDQLTANRIINSIDRHFDRIDLSQLQPEDLLPYLKADKKNVSQNITYCPLHQIGKVSTDGVISIDEVIKVVRNYKNLCIEY